MPQLPGLVSFNDLSAQVYVLGVLLHTNSDNKAANNLSGNNDEHRNGHNFRLAQLHNNNRYDTIHGKYDGTVEPDGDSLVIDGKKAD